MEEMRFKQSQPTKVYQDNKSTIILSNKGSGFSGGTRHMKNRYYFIKQSIDDGDIELEYLPTNEMIADYLTKPLGGTRFKNLRSIIMGNKLM